MERAQLILNLVAIIVPAAAVIFAVFIAHKLSRTQEFIAENERERIRQKKLKIIADLFTYRNALINSHAKPRSALEFEAAMNAALFHFQCHEEVVESYRRTFLRNGFTPDGFEDFLRLLCKYAGVQLNLQSNDIQTVPRVGEPTTNESRPHSLGIG